MLKERISEDWKNAFKNNDSLGKSALGYLKAKILNVEKSGKYELPLQDSIIEDIISKEIKEFQETQQFYTQETQMYKDLEYKINLLTAYLPKQMTEDEVKLIISKIISTGETNLGRVIGLTIKEIGSRFDKSKVSVLVKEVLS